MQKTPVFNKAIYEQAKRFIEDGHDDQFAAAIEGFLIDFQDPDDQYNTYVLRVYLLTRQIVTLGSGL